MKYNWRNLWVRKTSTIITAFSVALAAFVCTFLLGVIDGFKSCIHSSGDPRNALILRDGSRREVVSAVSRDAVPVIKYLPGIATDAAGEPLVSPEVLVLITLRKLDGTRANVGVRGVTATGIKLRPQFRLSQGRMYRPGAREVIASRDMAAELGVALDQSINFGRGRWQLVGIFENPNTVYNSEIWADVDALASDFGRRDYSSLLVRMSDSSSEDLLNAELSKDRRLHFKAVNQQSYFDSQNEGARPLELFSIFIVLIMAVGAVFAAVNTMHTVISLRTSEITTLRVLGFSQLSIILSFFAEAVILTALGGIVGSIAAVFTNTLTASTTNFVTFSSLAFHVHVTVLDILAGLCIAIAIGAIGGLVPSWWATREMLASGLRAS